MWSFASEGPRVRNPFRLTPLHSSEYHHQQVCRAQLPDPPDEEVEQILHLSGSLSDSSRSASIRTLDMISINLKMAQVLGANS